MDQLIINGRAGVLVGDDGEQVLSSIRQAFAAEGIEVDLKVRTGKGIDQAIEEAVRSDSDRIIVGGGDGTINTAAAAVARTGKILGILPMGTLNLYAQDIGMPLDPAEAVHALIHGAVGRVDVAEVNGRIYLCNSIIGIVPSLMRQREEIRGKPLHRRVWGLIHKTFLLFRQNPKLRITYDADGKSRRMKVRGIAVCNNAYHDAFALFPHEVPLDSGKLMVYLAVAPSRWGMLRLAVRLFLGTWEKESEIHSFPMKEVNISSSKSRLTAVTDGELIEMRPPLTYCTRPRQLRVILPPETIRRLSVPVENDR